MKLNIKQSIILILIIIPCMVYAQGDTAVCSEQCSCAENMTPAGVMISHVHNKGEWMLSYRFMSMGMKGLLSGTHAFPEQQAFNTYTAIPDAMRMDMHMLMGMYGISDRLTVMAMLNYNANTMGMAMMPSTGGHHHGTGDAPADHNMKSSGIGDMKLYAMYAPLKSEDRQLVISAGVSIPTGTVKAKGAAHDMMYPSQRLPYNMQLGSGTTDLLPGITYLCKPGKWSLGVQLQSVLRMGYNSIGYRYGNEISQGAWAVYSWHRKISSSLRIDNTLSGKMSGYDPGLYRYNEPGANSLNYGGQRLNAYLGSQVHIGKNQLAVEYGLPLYQDVNGVQMKFTHTLQATYAIAW